VQVSAARPIPPWHAATVAEVAAGRREKIRAAIRIGVNHLAPSVVARIRFGQFRSHVRSHGIGRDTAIECRASIGHYRWRRLDAAAQKREQGEPLNASH